ncbi:MAG: hypothetical protein P8170_16400, partial [Gemmatimonadota bacterium]
MVNPALALSVFGVLVLMAALVLWPGRGLVPRLMRAARLDERVRLEDALKHVYMCERRRQPCSLESMAGRLGVSTKIRRRGVLAEIRQPEDPLTRRRDPDDLHRVSRLRVRQGDLGLRGPLPVR